MTLAPSDWWIIATAAACSALCGLLGVYLVLRRLSMLGDAISHAVLPGLAGAFLLSGTRDLGPMLVGAATVGLLTAAASAALARSGRVREDAAMGIVFTTLFALGVVIIAVLPSRLHLDADHVLYGNLEQVFLAVPVGLPWSIAGVPLQAPRPFATVAATLLICAVLAVLFFKELKLVAFDPALATAMGFSAAVVHYAVITAVAGASVVCFEAVGSVLVVAMLVAPAATAHLLTDRLGRMTVLSVILGISAGLLGSLAAIATDVKVAGMIAVVGGGQFALAALFAPQHGAVPKLSRRLSLRLRVVREDLLGLLYRWHEASTSGPKPGLTPDHAAAAIGAGVLARLSLASLRREGSIVTKPDGTLALSPAGLAAARELISGHRLWEAYLARHLGLPLDHLHEPSHRVEHYLSANLRQTLREELGEQQADPHGKPIPPA